MDIVHNIEKAIDIEVGNREEQVTRTELVLKLTDRYSLIDNTEKKSFKDTAAKYGFVEAKSMHPTTIRTIECVLPLCIVFDVMLDGSLSYRSFFNGLHSKNVDLEQFTISEEYLIIKSEDPTDFTIDLISVIYSMMKFWNWNTYYFCNYIDNLKAINIDLYNDGQFIDYIISRIRNTSDFQNIFKNSFFLNSIRKFKDDIKRDEQTKDLNALEIVLVILKKLSAWHANKIDTEGSTSSKRPTCLFEYLIDNTTLAG